MHGAKSVRTQYKSDVEESEKTAPQPGCDCPPGYWLCLGFDFSQALEIPHMRNCPSKFYFSSLLQAGIFGVADEGRGTQTNYVLRDGYFRKGANVVSSLLLANLDFIGNHYKARGRGKCEIDLLTLYADNCKGQNKNNCVLHLLLWVLARGNAGSLHVKEIRLNFFFKGHSKFSADRGFANVRKKYGGRDIFNYEQLEEAVNSTVSNTAVLVEEDAIKTYKQALEEYFVKFPGMTSYQQFRFTKDKPGIIQYRKVPSDEWEEIDLWKSKAFTLKQVMSSNLSLSVSNRQKASRMRRSFKVLDGLLKVETGKGLPLIKQRQLFEKIGPCVPEQHKRNLYDDAAGTKGITSSTLLKLHKEKKQKTSAA